MLQQNSSAQRRWIWIAAACVVVAAAGIYWYATKTPAADASGTAGSAKGKGGGKQGAAQTMPVVAVPAKTGDIGVYLNGLGAVTPLYTVTVKSRVDGQLMEVLFKEGQLVRAGELLAIIDARPYEAALLQAQGQMARDTALLKNARVDLERYRTLFAQDSIAEQLVVTQESLVAQYEGTVKIDQAAIDTARVNLVYCRITAPVAGRIGLRLVDPGNIVHSADATGMLVITQLQPISAIFTIPEDNVPSVMKRLQAGEKLPVDVWDRAETVKLASGTLLTMDNQIDPTTGTVKLRALFANQDFALFPNQFVNAHMLVETKHGATLIPTAAIQRGTPGTFVYVVKSDNTVTVRPIKLGTTQADRASVDGGVEPGDMVVVDGADKLREGATVTLPVRDSSAGASKGKGGKKADAGAGGESLTPEERKKRWDDLNARIDKGEFGEDIKKLPEDQRKQKMRELRAKRDSQPEPAKQ